MGGGWWQQAHRNRAPERAENPQLPPPTTHLPVAAVRLMAYSHSKRPSCPTAVVSGRLFPRSECQTVANGYCMKCKTQREIKSPKQITMKNGRPATEGTCPTCGTKIFKIGAGK